MTQTTVGHTPGPWTVSPSMDLNGAYFIHEVAAAAEEDRIGVEWEQDEANARLIAAAPDLLVALQKAVALLGIATLNGKSLYGATSVQVARGIIANATGQ